MAALTFVRFLLHRSRRLAWFRPTHTPFGQTVPARLGRRTIGFLALLPFSVLLTVTFAVPWFVMANGLILALVIVDDWWTVDWFTIGMRTGRAEVVAEMLTAWTDNRMSPNEWLAREAELIKATDEYSRQ